METAMEATMETALDTTKFPIDTDRPKMDVTLPVGTHVLKLTIVDDAGLTSTDTVVITVKPVRKPDVTNIVPVRGLQGASVRAVV